MVPGIFTVSGKCPGEILGLLENLQLENQLAVAGEVTSMYHPTSPPCGRRMGHVMLGVRRVCLVPVRATASNLSEVPTSYVVSARTHIKLCPLP